MTATIQFQLKSGSTSPALEAFLVDGDHAAINLEGASVVFTMQAIDGDVIIDRVAATIVDAEAGEVRYSWAEGETDAPADYLAEFSVTFPDGEVSKFPSDDWVAIRILGALA
ncbi:MAG: DUF2479 domain-containing protein [Chloroflexi bacterium]|nr:DUF2479 domain-containing protein [Chloroflexota bacterium]